MFIRTLLRRCALGLAVIVVATGIQPQLAFAGAYGVGGYSTCDYQHCTAPPPSTQTTLPSGLQIAVNLANGQTIPRNGYTITVTPLNGSGSSFAKADFYINGQLANSSIPDETGTASWFWDPTAFPGTDVKVITTATDGSTVTQEFQVIIEASAAEQPTTQPKAKASTPQSQSSSGPVAVLEQAFSGAKHFVASLPQPVVYGFPYILLILLGANVVLLLLQTWRELKAYRALQLFLARERNAATAKTTLLELIAHYFRTPLTILMGGIDMLQMEQATQLAASLKTTAEHLHAAIEQLLAQARAAAEAKVTVGGASDQPSTAAASLWRRPGLLLPVLLIAMIIVPFDLVAQDAGSLHGARLHLAVQAIVYTLLVLATYQVFRRLQLRRRENDELQVVTSDEQATAHARDEVIAGATTTLGADIAKISQLVAALPPTKAREFIADGQGRFRDLLAKLTIASNLRGSSALQTPQPVKLSELFAAAMQTLQPVATKRGITVQFAADEDDSAVVRPELLTFVLRSLLDNAIAYSPDKSTIQVTAHAGASDTTVTVADSGSGIADDKLSLLFQPFSKLEGAEVFTHEGMGFSLYLDSVIMQYLGGTISLDSQPGQGTLAQVTLPLASMPNVDQTAA